MIIKKNDENVNNDENNNDNENEFFKIANTFGRKNPLNTRKTTPESPSTNNTSRYKLRSYLTYANS